MQNYKVKILESHKKHLREIKRIKKRLSKIRVGLPTKVIFEFKLGIITCMPKEKKWMIDLDDRLISFNKRGRNNITAHSARLLLKLALADLIKSEKRES